MKKIPVLMLSLLTLPTYAQSILGTLNQHQGSLKPPVSEGSSTSSSSTTTQGTPDVKPSTQSSSSASSKCEENDQTSVPLAYMTSLIQEKEGKFDIIHDPRNETLTVSAPGIIGNCSSMLEWTLKKPEILGEKSYAIEVKIKQGEQCDAGACSYKVATVLNGEFQEHKEMKFKPTLKGFEECLKQSGVIANGKVVTGAIYNTPVSEKLSGVEASGKLLFLSHGPSSPLVKAKYGKFEHISGCDYYESAHPGIKQLLTAEDEEKARLDAEAAKLKDCKAEEYGKLSEFIEKYENYSDELGQIRDKLILESVKKAAAAIQSGKYTEEDLKVIADFEKYLVQPKIEYARALYEKSLDLAGDEKKATQEELKKVLAEITSYNQKPYFTTEHTLKLIQGGRFEEAEKLNNLKLVLGHHQRLGAKQDNVVITPGVASQRIAADRLTFAANLEKEKEKYEIRTGQTTGKSEYYGSLARRMRNSIQIRTENFTSEIRLEYERIQQPNGYCYKYWRNTQACIQETQERLQELQALLKHYNSVDEERAKEYDAQAKSYGDLEAEGRRYVAGQNGEAVEEAPAAAPSQQPSEDTSRPKPRAQGEDGVYSFNYNQPQQQAQMTPQQYQYPSAPQQNYFQQQNPYQSYQQPWLGQQAYPQYQNYSSGPQASYGFNWGGGAQMQQQPQYYQQQQQPQQGYWGNPNQAYAGYSIYGRTW